MDQCSQFQVDVAVEDDGSWSAPWGYQYDGAQRWADVHEELLISNASGLLADSMIEPEHSLEPGYWHSGSGRGRGQLHPGQYTWSFKVISTGQGILGITGGSFFAATTPRGMGADQGAAGAVPAGADAGHPGTYGGGDDPTATADAGYGSPDSGGYAPLPSPGRDYGHPEADGNGADPGYAAQGQLGGQPEADPAGQDYGYPEQEQTGGGGDTYGQAGEQEPAPSGQEQPTDQGQSDGVGQEYEYQGQQPGEGH